MKKLFKFFTTYSIVFLMLLLSCNEFDNSSSFSLSETELDIQSRNKFELQPSESYLIFGKGPGQDGAINPFNNYIKASTGRVISSNDCFVTIKNTGTSNFTLRIQKSNINSVVELIPIQINEMRTIELYAGYELYTDANSEEIASFEVLFKPKYTLN